MRSEAARVSQTGFCLFGVFFWGAFPKGNYSYFFLGFLSKSKQKRLPNGKEDMLFFLPATGVHAKARRKSTKGSQKKHVAMMYVHCIILF